MGVIVLLVMVVALVDIISSDEAVVRGLPRWGWLLLVVLLPLVGSLVWFAAGRPATCREPFRRPLRQSASRAGNSIGVRRI